MKTKIKTSKRKYTTDLVWVDIALTSDPSNALTYGFMSPELVPIVNNLLNGSSHSIVIGGTCFELTRSHPLDLQYKEELLRKATKWEEVSK